MWHVHAPNHGGRGLVTEVLPVAGGAPAPPSACSILADEGMTFPPGRDYRPAIRKVFGLRDATPNPRSPELGRRVGKGGFFSSVSRRISGAEAVEVIRASTQS
jgi:hypothetical protein